MTVLTHLAPTDKMLALMIPFLLIATLALATEAHAFCSIFCMHGDPMIETEICSGRPG